MARAIELGYANSTSMGCRCGSSICSICGNKAITEDDFCEHVKNYKGSTFNGLPVFEDNRDIEFFENSIVCEPADPEAKILEKVASRNNSIVRTYNKKPKNDLSIVVNEKNQRTFAGRVENFSDKLKNIPWT